MTKEYVAYSGSEYQVEWYYAPNGKSQALEYFNELSESERIKTWNLFRSLAESGRIYSETKFRYEGNKIYAFKPHPHRFLCFFFEGRKVIVTNAFWKKQDKLPENEKYRALKSMESFKQRRNDNTYYEKDED